VNEAVYWLRILLYVPEMPDQLRLPRPIILDRILQISLSKVPGQCLKPDHYRFLPPTLQYIIN